MAESMTAEPETLEFQADTKTLLNLMVNSLYTHKEVFLRELISNASDALDKLRLRALTEHDILGEDKDLEIVITPDAEAKTITICDNGIGMTQEELRNNLGTIARSGSREFSEQLQELNKEGKDASTLIGQFGVGFYSAFLVADKVSVVSRPAGSEEAFRWESDGQGTFTLAPAEREGRGTEVVLHVRADQEDFLKAFSLRNLVQKYSDFIGHPIKLIEETVETSGEGDDEKEVKAKTSEVINKGKALWTRPKSEITDEQYEEFYKHVSRDWEPPLARTHFKIEGTQLFSGLLFVPKKPPFDLFARESRSGVRLYVKRVFVMDECDALLPEYLRFIRGIVDSDDLPLNVSREVLQQDRLVESIKTQVTKKSLQMLQELADGSVDDYKTFWDGYGKVLKEGVHTDYTNRDKLAKLLRFESSTQDGLTSLDDYISRMGDDQEHIHFISGPSKDFLKSSPHIEGLKAKGCEVLFFTDPVDEWIAMGLPEYEGKKLLNATKGASKLEGDDESKAEEEKTEDALTKAINAQLGDAIGGVRYTDRLTDSPVCLVSGEFDPGANLERILKAHGGGALGGAGAKRTLELNATHPLIENLKKLAADDAHSEKLGEWTGLLYDQALLTEGSQIDDPAAFAKNMNALLLQVSASALGSDDASE